MFSVPPCVAAVTLSLRLPLPLRVLFSGRVPVVAFLTLIRSKTFLPWSGARVSVEASSMCLDATTSSVGGGSDGGTALVNSGHPIPGTLLARGECMLATWSGTFAG
jgi:hypothetical protein